MPVCLFIAVTAVLHWAVTDLDHLYRLGNGTDHIPRVSVINEHPWDAFFNRPAPEYAFGGNPGLEGQVALSTILPFAQAALALVSPTRLDELMFFEWHLTGLFILVCMLSVYAFARRVGSGTYLAAALAVSIPYTTPIFYEYDFASPLRGRLLVPLVFLAVGRAFDRGTYARWIAASLALVFCVAQTFLMFWLPLPLAVWGTVVVLARRHALLMQIRSERWRFLRRVGPIAVATAIVGVAFVPHFLRMQREFDASSWFYVMSTNKYRLWEYVWAHQMGIRPGLASRLTDPARIGYLSALAPFLPMAVLVARRSLVQSFSGPAGLRSRATLITGSLIAAVGFGLIFLADVRADLLFDFSGQGIRVRLTGTEASPAIRAAFRAPIRTWYPMLVFGEMMLVSALAPRLFERTPDLRQRLGRGAIVFGCFVLLDVVVAWSAPIRLVTIAPLCLKAGLVVGTLILIGSPRVPLRRMGGVALVGLGLVSAWQGRALSFARKPQLYWSLSLSGSEFLHAQQQILERIPQEAKGQYGYRLASDFTDMAYVLHTASATTCLDKLVPRAAYELMMRVRGPQIAEMFGIRYVLRVEPWAGPDVPYYDVDKCFDFDRAEFEPPITVAMLPRVGPIQFYRNPEAFPKGWLLQRWHAVRSDEQALSRMVELAAAQALRAEGVVTNPPWASGGNNDPPAVVRPGSLRIRTVAPGHLAFSTDLREPQLLATNEIFHPDWSLRIDGERAPILRVNHALVGALIPEGRHEIVFRRPGE